MPDKSEFSVSVRNKVKEVFKAISDLQTKIEEITDENMAKLKLELAKYNITVPELSEIKANVEKAIEDGKLKVDEFVSVFNKKTETKVAA